MATVKTTGYAPDYADVEVEIDDAVIAQAATAAYDEDRLMVVGRHPSFGWVYRDAEDAAAIAELGATWAVDSSGLVT